MKVLRYLLPGLLIFALFLSACAPAETPAGGEAEEAAPASQEGAPAEDETVTLRFWSHQNPAFIQGNEYLIDLFEEAHPNINIVYEQFEYDVFVQTLQTSMPAGTEADVMEMFGTWVCTYARGNRLDPLPESVLTQGEVEELMFEAPLGGYTCDGRLYGLPNEFNLEVGGALANQTHFEEAGLAWPPQWNTMEDLLADARALTVVDGGQMVRSGFHFVHTDALGFLFLEGILEQGGQYINGPETPGDYFNFNSPEAVETIRTLVSMVENDNVVDPVLFNADSNWVGDAFFNGQVSIGYVGSWAAAEGRVNFPDVPFEYVQTPPLFGTEFNFAADAGWGKVVSTNSQHKEEAWEFVRFMTLNRENAEKWNEFTGTIPALKAPVEDQSILEQVPWIEPVLPILSYGDFLGPILDRDQLWGDIFYQHLLSALQGLETPEEAAEAIDADADEMAEGILGSQ